jgi:diaminopimelate epimerase
MSKIAFTKGHGTGNDFVLVLDADGALTLNKGQISRICNRHFGSMHTRYRINNE